MAFNFETKWDLIKKQIWCRWFHRKHMCFPEVWDRGLKGPWHCEKCHPCSEELDIILKRIDNVDK